MNKHGRLIDADALLDALEVDPIECPGCPEPEFLPEIRALLEEAPPVDAVEVVRCRDCRYWKKDHVLDWYTLLEGHMVCTYAIAHSFVRHPEDFCSKGERKDGKGNGDETDLR